ncbi:MAG: hypothetical protein IPL46_31950 [Saprospiraceae bacterium]|nr:hypothetical protein [Saprospiraceae bacterium]
MAEGSLIKVGRILKSFGVNGQLRCQINEQFVGLLKKEKYVWVDIDGLMVPLLINKFIPQHKPLITFIDINDERQANLISGHWVYLKKEDYQNISWPAGHKEGPEFEFLKGFLAIFSQHGLQGKVIDVLEYPGQEMAFIVLNDLPEKEFLVPLVDEFILAINEQDRSITFAVPDGLLAL